MIHPKDFTKVLCDNNLGPVVEVPCSYFKDFLNYLWDTKEMEVINPVNEALVMGVASGLYLGSGKIPVVAIQNSGLMNTLNALTSLNQIYDIPVFMMVTWRGEGGVGKDAPEHDITGAYLEKILGTFDLPYEIIDENHYEQQIERLTKKAQETKKPVVLVIKKNTFEKYNISLYSSRYEMKRIDAIRIIKQEAKDKALFISSTGFPTRDSYAAQDSPDFYIVGSMGHAFSIALGLSSSTDKKIIILDGDGSFLMHVGGLASFNKKIHKNIISVVLDNESYESTGGQPIAGSTNYKKLASSFGFKNIYETKKKEELKKIVEEAISKNESSFIHIKISLGEEKASKRVSDEYSCPIIKERFMDAIKKHA